MSKIRSQLEEEKSAHYTTKLTMDVPEEQIQLLTRSLEEAVSLDRQLSNKIRSLVAGRRLVMAGSSLDMLEALQEQFVDLDHQLTSSADELFSARNVANTTLAAVPEGMLENIVTDSSNSETLEAIIKRIAACLDTFVSSTKRLESDLETTRANEQNAIQARDGFQFREQVTRSTLLETQVLLNAEAAQTDHLEAEGDLDLPILAEKLKTAVIDIRHRSEEMRSEKRRLESALKDETERRDSVLSELQEKSR